MFVINVFSVGHICEGSIISWPITVESLVKTQSKPDDQANAKSLSRFHRTHRTVSFSISIANDINDSLTNNKSSSNQSENPDQTYNNYILFTHTQTLYIYTYIRYRNRFSNFSTFTNDDLNYIFSICGL